MTSAESGTLGETVTDGGVDQEDFHRREEEPNGLLYFTRFDSVPIMVDALFDAPSNREFTNAELAEKSSLSPKSVRDRIGILYQLGIISRVGDTDRCSLDLDNEITWKLRELDGLIKEAQIPNGGNGESQTSPEFRNIVDPNEEDSLTVMDRVREQATNPGVHGD